MVYWPYFFFLSNRCSWFEWRPNHWTNARKVSVCIGRVLPFPISKSTDTFWQTPTEITFTTNSVIGCDRAVVFCSLSWQDTYWDPYPRHDYVRAFISMALNLITFYVFCDIGVVKYTCTSTTAHLCTPKFTYVGVTCDTFLASYIIVFQVLCKKY